MVMIPVMYSSCINSAQINTLRWYGVPALCAVNYETSYRDISAALDKVIGVL